MLREKTTHLRHHCQSDDFVSESEDRHWQCYARTPRSSVQCIAADDSRDDYARPDAVLLSVVEGARTIGVVCNQAVPFHCRNVQGTSVFTERTRVVVLLWI